MWHRRCALVAVLVLALVAGLAAQSGPEREASWKAFIAWWKAAPVTGNPFTDYAAKLRADGKADDEVKKEVALLTSLFAERTDWVGIWFDKVYSRPLTGDPAKDGFNTRPSELLVDATKGLKPGTALDAGVGQGRNAVYLAQQGWTVTGFDVSGEALVATAANAARVGVRVTTVQASYSSFDFGTERWDLIVLAFAWAPVNDPAFVGRLRASLRPGGRVVFEHFVMAAERPGPVAPGGQRAQGSSGPNLIRMLKPDELRACFTGFGMAFYEEADGTGDWGGPGSRLVRMIAVKR